MLECLKKQQKQIDSELAKMLKVDEENKRFIEILSSIKCVGPVLKAYYVHLKSKGKESKVAIVACLRKLLSIMNMMVRKDETWREMSKGGAS